MAIDVMAKSFVTHNSSISYGGASGGTKTEYTPYSQIYDGNGSTYWGSYWSATGDDMHNLATTTAETTWTESLKISSLVASSYQYQSSDGDAYISALNYTRFYLYLKISGAWTLIDSKEVTSPSVHGGSTSQTHSYSGSTGWSAVTGVRYILANARTSDSSEYNPGQNITLDSRIYTVTTEVDWVDSGIRVKDGSGTTSIACHTLDGDQLRFNDSGTIKGIPLVATTSGFASPIRIKTGSDVLSLAEYS